MKKTIYNEKVYLNGDEEAFASFRKDREKTIMLKQRESGKYFYTIGLYDEYISQLADFLKTFDFQSSFEYYLALSYFIHKGYLSENHSFSYGQPKNELISRRGISVLNGIGYCRNIASLASDVMKKLELPSKKIYCSDYRFQYQRENSKVNHVINLVEFENQIYGIDLLNDDKLFYFVNSFDISELSLHSNHQLRYKPYSEFTMAESTLGGIRKTIRLFTKSSQCEVMHPFYYEEFIKEYMKEENKQNRSLYEDFYGETKCLRKEITQSCLKK